MMMAKPIASKKYDLERANSALTLVNAIVTDFVQLSRQLIDREQRLDHLTNGRQLNEANPYEEELAQVARELKQSQLRLAEFAAELDYLGVRLTDKQRGAVDFPAMIDGRPGYFCWKLGESEIRFWHGETEDCTLRRPLTVQPAGGPLGRDHN